MIKLWLIKRTDPIGYDEFDSMIVAAPTEEEARTYHPNGVTRGYKKDGYWEYKYLNSSYYPPPSWYGWGRIEDLEVSYLGTTDREIQGVILASFNAGQANEVHLSHRIKRRSHGYKSY